MTHHTRCRPTPEIKPPAAHAWRLLVRVAAALLWACLIAAILAGCRPQVLGYEGEPLPPDQIAGIRTNTIDAQAHLVIEAVDGRRLNVTHAQVLLLPGPHTLHIRVATAPPIDFNRLTVEDPAGSGVRLTQPVKTYWLDVPITVEAGHRYVLNGAAEGSHASVWVLDELNGQRVVEVRQEPTR